MNILVYVVISTQFASLPPLPLQVINEVPERKQDVSTGALVNLKMHTKKYTFLSLHTNTLKDLSKYIKTHI